MRMAHSKMSSRFRNELPNRDKSSTPNREVRRGRVERWVDAVEDIDLVVRLVKYHQRYPRPPRLIIMRVKCKRASATGILPCERAAKAGYSLQRPLRQAGNHQLRCLHDPNKSLTDCWNLRTGAWMTRRSGPFNW